MSQKNKNDYYNIDDEILFGKLDRFHKYNSKIKNDKLFKNQNTKYSNSDKNYFNNIIKTDKKFSLLNEVDVSREINYYNSSDFKKFEDLNKFTEYKTNLDKESYNKKDQTYTSKDELQFDNIINTVSNENEIQKNVKQKVKIIDYGKSKEKDKSIKNKVGIENIKIVYFD